MERRRFLKGVLGIFGAAAAGVTLTAGSAEAAALDKTRDVAPGVDATPEVGAPDAEGQIYFVRRRYYRPRRVYYYRPRRVYYRPVYYRRPRYRVYW